MQWLRAGAAYELPQTCDPANAFLQEYSRIFHTCVPTPLAFASNTLGALSILAWLFAQLPQIYKNWRISSTSGLSIFFLAEWCLGDLCNLLGALLTHQAPWQVCIGAYYVFVDLCLVAQWIWYERLRHGNPIWSLRRKRSQSPREWQGDRRGSTSTQAIQHDRRAQDHATSRPRMIFRTPTFDPPSGLGEKPSTSWYSMSFNRPTVYRAGPSSSSPLASPRTILFIACLASLACASPIAAPTNPTSTPKHRTTTVKTLGTFLSWSSTFLYLVSRFPQLLKNWKRKSTAGLSPQLFAAAFMGNLLYSAALSTNPNAWSDFEPHGGRGWAGPNGNSQEAWVAAAMPFFLGAAGVLLLDASVGLQFLIYGETAASNKETVASTGALLDASDTPRIPSPTRPGAWRRVSGWMRGWVPNIAMAERTTGNAHNDIIQATERRPLLWSMRSGTATATTTTDDGVATATNDGSV